MNKILNGFERYDFEKASKGDKVIVATLNFGKLQSLEFHTVKSVSLKLGRVTLDNDLKYSKDGREYGRDSFVRNIVFSSTKESDGQVNDYLDREVIARRIMNRLPKITKEKLIGVSQDTLAELDTTLKEVLRRADHD